jgi:hypothetical protein
VQIGLVQGSDTDQGLWNTGFRAANLGRRYGASEPVEDGIAVGECVGRIGHA